MAVTVQNPLTLDEIKDIYATMVTMVDEIHHPGAARSQQFDLLSAIEDSLYRLADVIERTEHQAA